MNSQDQPRAKRNAADEHGGAPTRGLVSVVSQFSGFFSQFLAFSQPSGAELDRGQAAPSVPRNDINNAADTGAGLGGPGGKPRPVLNAQVLAVALAGLKRGFWVVALFSVVSNLLALTSSLYMLQLSDRVLLSGNTDTLIMLTVVTVAAIAAYGALEILRKMLLIRMASGFEVDLGANVLTAALTSMDVSKSRDVQPLRDVQTVRSFMSSGVVPSLCDAPLAPLYILIVWLIHPQLGWITIIGAAILIAMAILNQRMTTQAMLTANAHAMEAMSQAFGQARNTESVLAMGMIDDCVANWGKANAKALTQQAVASDLNAQISGASKAIRLLLQIALLGWGAWLALNGEVSGGGMIVASIIAGRGLQPIEAAIDGWRVTVQAYEAFTRLNNMLTRPELPHRLELAAPKGRITVERLTYAPPGSQKPILHGVSFELAPGESLAVIGPSGAGKSTLARLLVGTLRPSAGAVRLDGFDLSTWDRRQLGPHIGYVPQSIELFPGTVAMNIARMKIDAPSGLIHEAVRLSEVEDLVSRLPGSYNLELGIDGAPLSGGQKQRIALARAFFGRPCFLVLDEPNSNLDGLGEQALLTALRNAKAAAMTVVVITQRPSLLRAVDKILSLKDGRLDLFGPAEKVLSEMRQVNPHGQAR